jgi:hypothetical protein
MSGISTELIDNVARLVKVLQDSPLVVVAIVALAGFTVVGLAIWKGGSAKPGRSASR